MDIPSFLTGVYQDQMPKLHIEEGKGLKGHSNCCQGRLTEEERRYFVESP